MRALTNTIKKSSSGNNNNSTSLVVPHPPPLPPSKSVSSSNNTTTSRSRESKENDEDSSQYVSFEEMMMMRDGQTSSENNEDEYEDDEFMVLFHCAPYLSPTNLNDTRTDIPASVYDRAQRAAVLDYERYDEIRTKRSIRFLNDLVLIHLPRDERIDARKARRSHWKTAPIHDELWDGNLQEFRPRPLTPEELKVIMREARLEKLPKAAQKLLKYYSKVFKRSNKSLEDMNIVDATSPEWKVEDEDDFEDEDVLIPVPHARRGSPPPLALLASHGEKLLKASLAAKINNNNNNNHHHHRPPLPPSNSSGSNSPKSSSIRPHVERQSSNRHFTTTTTTTNNNNTENDRPPTPTSPRKYRDPSPPPAPREESPSAGARERKGTSDSILESNDLSSSSATSLVKSVSSPELETKMIVQENVVVMENTSLQEEIELKSKHTSDNRLMKITLPEESDASRRTSTNTVATDNTSISTNIERQDTSASSSTDEKYSPRLTIVEEVIVDYKPEVVDPNAKRKWGSKKALLNRGRTWTRRKSKFFKVGDHGLPIICKVEYSTFLILFSMTLIHLWMTSSKVLPLSLASNDVIVQLGVMILNSFAVLTILIIAYIITQGHT